MASAPFFLQRNSVSRIMLWVLAALLPVVGASVGCFGIGVLVQLMLATFTAVLTEAGVLYLRRRPMAPSLLDGSAVLTGWLLALSLPPLAPWWLVVLGTALALLLAKHLYGGLGQNPFNPAMVGFAILIVCFPAQMARWPGAALLHDVALQWQTIFSGAWPAMPDMDAVASATPLDVLRAGILQGQGLAALQAHTTWSGLAGQGVAWLGLGALLGGLVLLAKRIINWHTPVALLLALSLLAALAHALNPDRFASPLFHLLSGGTLLAAFFIATDPVTAPTTPRGRLIYAGLIGVLIWVIRTYGNYPDGVAFAVLVMNMATPLIDQLTKPPAFGHKRGRAS